MSNKKELVGIIQNKKLDRVKNKKSEYYGNTYWRLKVFLDQEEKEILVFKESLERESVWKELEIWELKKGWNQQYLFKVQRKPGAGQIFRLLDLEILENHGSH